MDFYSYRLTARSPLHIGQGRSGVVARTRSHVPAHLFYYALTALLASERGKQGFAAHRLILDELCEQFRFGPAFIIRDGRRLSQAEIERCHITSLGHATLDHARRAAVDGALYDVESLVFLHDSAACLQGGVWCEKTELDGEPLDFWFSRIYLGGERKLGYGQVNCSALEPEEKYPGVGKVVGDVVDLAGDVLPGAALDGVGDVPLVPWVGRRYDEKRGAGRALEHTLVFIDGRVPAEGACYRPCAEPGPRLGCWEWVDRELK